MLSDMGYGKREMRTHGRWLQVLKTSKVLHTWEFFFVLVFKYKSQMQTLRTNLKHTAKFIPM